MYNFKKIIPIIAILCSLNLSAQTYEEAACKFLDAINFDHNLLEMNDRMVQKLIESSPEAKQYKEGLKEFINTCSYEDNVNKNKTIEIYKNLFTIEELEELTQLITSTPTLKKYVSKQDIIKNKSAEVFQEIMTKKRPLLSKLMEENKLDSEEDSSTDDYNEEEDSIS